MQFSNEHLFAQSLDEKDDVKEFRDRFIIPTKGGKEQIYFLGNSLGLQPKNTASYIQKVLEQWSQSGVDGFFTGDEPWYHYHDQLTKPLSAIVGGLPHEVVIMNSLTVNLHLMMVSFYQPAGKRIKILCEAKAFPSDQYMLETHVQQRGFSPDEVIVEVAPGAGNSTIDGQDIIDAINQCGDELALVLWGGVNYYTGQVFNMQAITAAAHSVGAKVGFDLAHAAGNCRLQLHQWHVDFACWCNYKYLNAGPGSVGAAYIHERYHHDNSLHRFAGWWGYEKDTRFHMQKGFKPVLTAEGWQLSTPSPLLFAAQKASLQLFEQAGVERLQKKSKMLSNYLLFIIDDINTKLHQPFIQIITPLQEEERGCQVSMLMLWHGRKIFDDLSTEGIFADWREPDVIRIAPVPLYNTFEEVWMFGRVLERSCKKYTTF